MTTHTAQNILQSAHQLHARIGQPTRPDTFLSVAEVEALTGRKKHSLQIALLKKIGMPFWVNARGQPIIARTALEGRKETVKPPAANESWVPNVLRKKAG